MEKGQKVNLLTEASKTITICLERTINLGNYNSMKVGLHGTYEYVDKPAPELNDQFNIFKEDLESRFSELVKVEADKFSVNNVTKMITGWREDEFK